VPLQVEFYILLSVSENKLGHKTAALDYLKKALELAEIGNIRQLFIEVADDIRALLQELCGGVEVTGFSSVVLQDLQKEQQAASIRINGPILHVSEKLTNREMDVITLLEKRLTNQEIANKLSISVATVKRHTVTIYQKLNAKNRREAVIIAVREGILSL
jgi:DNA-binding NarL/FixJ family response regulator